MTLDLSALRDEVKEIMALRGYTHEQVAQALTNPVSDQTISNFLGSATGSVGLVADLARWLGKSLKEYEKWHPKPSPKSSFLPTPTTLAKLQKALGEAGISSRIAKLLVDLAETEAKERLEKVRRDFVNMKPKAAPEAPEDPDQEG